MKKNWLALISITLNIVLIVMMVGMQTSLEGQIRHLSTDIDNVEHRIETTLDNVSNRIRVAVEDASKQVKEYE